MPNNTTISNRADQRLRRLARSAGFSLHRSRAGISVDNQGGYRLVDASTDWVVAGERFDLDHDDILELLTDGQRGS